MIEKYDAKIKFDKILGYQNEGNYLKQGCQNSNLNRLCWSDEIFRIRKYEEKIEFDKIGGTTKQDLPQTRTPKFKLFNCVS